MTFSSLHLTDRRTQCARSDELALLFCALPLTTRPAAAQDIDALYRAVGDRHRHGRGNRQIGFRLAMEDVIVRVSGDYR